MDSPRPNIDDLNVVNMLKSYQSGRLFKSNNDLSPALVRMMKFSKYPGQMMAYVQSKGWDKKFSTSVDASCRLSPGDITMNYNGLIGIVSIDTTENDGKYLVNQMYLGNWDTLNSKPYIETEIMRLSWMNRTADEDKITLEEPMSCVDACKLVAANLQTVVPTEVKCVVGYNDKYNKIEVNMGGVDYYNMPWNERFSAMMDDIRKDMKNAGYRVDVTRGGDSKTDCVGPSCY